MTGVMSRSVVTLSALFLIACGLIPKVEPWLPPCRFRFWWRRHPDVGMVLSAGVSMLSSVNWSRRNMMILATSMSIGLGLQQVPKSMQHLPDWLEMLAVSGLLPVAVISVVLNLILPEDDS